MLVRRKRSAVQDQGGLHSWDCMSCACRTQDRYDNTGLLPDVKPRTYLRTD